MYARKYVWLFDGDYYQACKRESVDGPSPGIQRQWQDGVHEFARRPEPQSPRPLSKCTHSDSTLSPGHPSMNQCEQAIPDRLLEYRTRKNLCVRSHASVLLVVHMHVHACLSEIKHENRMSSSRASIKQALGQNWARSIEMFARPYGAYARAGLRRFNEDHVQARCELDYIKLR